MKKTIIYFTLDFGTFLLTAIKTFRQVSICGDRQSSHPVDIKALHLKDSLLLTGIDTIIVYRHWLGTNGFNGYGKVIWLDKGQSFQYKIDFENGSGNYGIKQVNLSKLISDSLISFFFNNHIDTVTSNPKKQEVQMSHDAEHFVQVNFKKKSYCYLISGLLVQFNSDNLRAKFVSLLSDENVSSIIIDGKEHCLGQK
ncbi:MAG: hypothetical protein IPF62_12120 [Bacteroidetes bacterium]|nr:hypothetical protein [Bacteroidota bacterium]